LIINQSDSRNREALILGLFLRIIRNDSEVLDEPYFAGELFVQYWVDGVIH